MPEAIQNIASQSYLPASLAPYSFDLRTKLWLLQFGWDPAVWTVDCLREARIARGAVHIDIIARPQRISLVR